MKLNDCLIDIVAYKQFLIDKEFPENTSRKNYFLATCLYLDQNCSLKDIDKENLYGGIIGIGNSKLEKHFSRYKVLRVHAAIHDACGYMKTKYGIGPGYCYCIDNMPNSCYLGHVSGLACILITKFLNKASYDSMEC